MKENKLNGTGLKPGSINILYNCCRVKPQPWKFLLRIRVMTYMPVKTFEIVLTWDLNRNI